MWLMGKDPNTGIDHNHRKALLLDHLKHLTRFYTVNVLGYAIMSNHFHLVVDYDPNGAQDWCEEEIARRWCAAHNKMGLMGLNGPTQLDDFSPQLAMEYHQILSDPTLMEQRRGQLAYLPEFMKHLKQPFSALCNRESGRKGHVFDGRYYSGMLLDEADVLACMAYVDLNPVQAGMAKSLVASGHTSIHERLHDLRFDPEQLDEYLAPLWVPDPYEAPSPTPIIEIQTDPEPESNFSDKADEEASAVDKADLEDDEQEPATQGRLPYYRPTGQCTFSEYTEQLNLAILYLTHPNADFPHKAKAWMARMLNRERKARRQDAAFHDYD